MRRRRRVVSESGLEELVRAHRFRESAEEKFRREVLFAHEAGSSLRAIAERIVMPHESVRAIVIEQRRLREIDLEMVKRLRGQDLLGRGFTTAVKDRSLSKARALEKKWCLSVQESDS
jgi:hypothetical protein